MLIVSMAAQGVWLAKPTDVSIPNNDSHVLMFAFSDTAALFLSLRVSPKTRGVFSAVDGCSPVGPHGPGLWNTLHEYAVNSGGHTNSLCQTATLYALHCQFTI